MRCIPLTISRQATRPGRCRFIIICIVLASTLCPPASAAPVVKVRPANETTAPVATYQLLEWAVELDRSYETPFDPDEIAVDAVFAGPGGKSLKVPAFWYRDYRRVEGAWGDQETTAVGQAHWRARFAAPAAGEWTLEVHAQDKTGLGKSAPVTFSVVPGTNPGFVRRTPGNTRYLQLDSGASFFIVGLNLGWGRLVEFENLLNRLSGVGGNFIRLWMSRPNRATETKDAGLGRYDLAACWHYDQIMEMARERGIYAMLTLGNYRDMVTRDYWGDADWPISPYNRVNGGPAVQPADYFTDPLARKMVKRRLRYLIGRYSAYTSMAIWEFWNEQDNIEIGSVAPWIREMASYVKANDPYNHLVTTSYSKPGEPEVWALPDIDITQRHFYGDEGSVHDAAPIISSDARQHDVFNKPHLMGELGISWRSSDSRFDPYHTGANLHTGLWAAALSGDAGGATIWWWYDYVVPLDLWWQFGPLSRFAASIDWARRDFQPVDVAAPTRDTTAPEVFRDLVFPAAGDWGKADPAPLVIGRDGQMRQTLPTFVYGPMKADMRTSLTLRVDLPRASTLVLRVPRASVRCTLRVSIDGATAGEMSFRPEPEPPGTSGDGTRHEPRFPVALNERQREVPLPAGIHTIELENVDGDWVALESLTLANALSSRITRLRPYVLADTASGETIAWLADSDANWYSDSLHQEPELFRDVSLVLPVPKAGPYNVEWWDTYKGVIIRTDTATAAGGRLSLNPPPFTRDVALRATLAIQR